MNSTVRILVIGLALALTTLGVTVQDAEAQGRGNRARPSATPQASLSEEVQSLIREFYASRPATGVEALPPGIRRNLQRGKPLPPGIAKRTVPGELRARVQVGEGYDLVEVGLDVFLVDVATDVVHDVLLDVVR